MRTGSGIIRTAVIAFAAVAGWACSDSGHSGGGGSGGTGTIALTVTDAPLTFDMVDEASIDVDRVTAATAATGDDGFITIYEGPPITMMLSELQNGATMPLAQADLPVGTYRQFRLHVTSARLVLINGNVYTTEDDTIHLTSQDTSGFHLFVDPPITIVEGQTTNVLLDFDLTHTFQPIPANDPLNATSFNLLPNVHISNLGETGGVEGTVMTVDTTDPVIGATVYLMSPGETNTDLSLAATSTNLLGQYAILGIQPGTYDVIAVKDLLTGTTPGVVVVAGESSNADVFLPAAIQGLRHVPDLRAAAPADAVEPQAAPQR